MATIDWVIGCGYLATLGFLGWRDRGAGAFTESALSASYTIKNFLSMGNLTLTGVVNNLFDNKHEVSGYGWNYGRASGVGAPITITGGAEYYVASERSWFGQLKLTLF